MRATRVNVLGSGLLAAVALSSAALGEVVKDERGFSFELPAGYAAQADLLPGTRTWGRGELGEASFARLTVTGLGGRIPTTPPNHTILEASARASAATYGLALDSFEYRPLRWRELELEVSTQHCHREHLRFVQHSLGLPFAREGVQVSLLGPEAESERLRSEFDGVIASFDGERSTDAPRAKETAWSTGETLGALCGLVVMLSIPLAAWRLFRKSG
ncbi:MAG: hypothetical protein SFW67_23820 [Myxococcaceae bacterium]|nr:hypothetical protein [Myxococcaceae bacterium]